MTTTEDALVISSVVLYLIAIPAFLYVIAIITQALQNGYLTVAAFDLRLTMCMIGYGGIVFAVLVSAVGGIIDGGFME